jgi:hypothetical protein
MCLTLLAAAATAATTSPFLLFSATAAGVSIEFFHEFSPPFCL